MDGLLTPPLEEYSEAVFSFNNKYQAPQKNPVTVAIIGAGYVGLHLIHIFSRFFRVIAYDIDERRLAELPELGVDEDVLRTSCPKDLRTAQYFLIAVPTNLNHDDTINFGPLTAAIRLVSDYGCEGATIVIESSVAVGMTRQLLEPVMRTRGFRGGMSPERVDPGRTFPAYEAIPKVISGLDDITKGSLNAIESLYSTVFHKIIRVTRPEVAEMTKLYENCQRMINVAYVNEMADACGQFGIDPLEVSRVAATKPFGYQPYTPSLGVGGHCIPINPYYLFHNSELPLLKAAATKMRQRPSQVTDKLVRELRSNRQSSLYPAQRLKALVVGVGFKRGQSELTNSPGLAVCMRLLDEHEAYVEYCDPLVDQQALSFVPRLDERSEWKQEILDERFDIIIVATDPVGLDIGVLQSLRRATVHNFTSCLPFGSLS